MAPLPVELTDDLRLLWRRGVPLEPPIRSQPFDGPALARHGRSLAASHELAAGDRGADFFPRLSENAVLLRAARALFERHVTEGLSLAPAAQRLLDDATLIEDQVAIVRLELSPGMFRLLPRLCGQPLAGLPRIYSVAWAWVAHTDSGLDGQRLEAYLGAYQGACELALAELRALPAMLRVVLLENLRRLAERSALLQAARDAAQRWIDADPPQRSLARLEVLDAAFDARGVSDAFRLRLQQHADGLPGAIGREVAVWLARRLPDVAAAHARAQQQADADDLSIGNALGALRGIDRQDWLRLAEAIHGAPQALAGLPLHAAECAATRQDSLRAIERLARQAGCTETRAAEVLVGLAAEATSTDAAQAAAAYWHAGPGLPRLRAALGLGASIRPARGSPAWRSAAVPLHLTGVLLLTALGVAALVRPVEAPTWLAVLVGALLVFPLSEVAVTVVARLLAAVVPTGRLPRLALPQGIEDGQRTLVVLPALLDEPDGVAALAAQLEQHAIANREPAVQFALLSDFPDAASEHSAADAALLAAARGAVEALNRRHPVAEGMPLRFLLLQRPRSWSESERRWTGWERQRGQIEQLIRRLADGEAAVAPFLALDALSQPALGVRHLVRLEPGTLLPPGSLRALVGVAAHPLNRPRLDEHGRIVAGHAILQPQLDTALPSAGAATWFDWLSASPCGSTAGVAPGARWHLGAFGEACHAGQGLIDVTAARATLVGRLPEAQLLGHGLLEGAIARCASVPDVRLIVPAPGWPDSADAQLHRSTRSAWQLLPFIRAARRHDLSPIGRWAMIDQLRRSLVAPSSMLLLLLVLASGVLPLGVGLLVVVTAFGAAPLLDVLAGVAPGRVDFVRRAAWRRAGAGMVHAAAVAAWHLAQLLQHALLRADAIGRALHRQLISRRRLLEWTPDAVAGLNGPPTVSTLLRRHWLAPALAALFAAALGFGTDGELTPARAAAMALLALWAAAPLSIWLVGRQRPLPRGDRLDRTAQSWLYGLARDSWRYHEHHVGAADHHLPPESVQATPQPLVVHRTSPTAIGSYLLATASAQALGFIGREEMVERLTATLDTLERLPRERGHFLANYDTRSLEPIAPPTVSSLDSGNLCAQLIAVGAACSALAAAPPTRAPAERALGFSRRRLQALRPAPAGAGGPHPLEQLGTQKASDWPSHAEELATRRSQVQAALGEFAGRQPGLVAAADADSSWLLHDHLAMLGSALRDMAPDASASPQRLNWLAERCRRLALEADFSFFRDPARGLLQVAWRVDGQRFEGGQHELLSSSARLASLFAIAKGDLPAAHWAALGRPLCAWRGRVGLRSAAGALSDHLMPRLLLDEPDGSVLHQAARCALAMQQADAQAAGTPWGESESAIAVRDAGLACQHASHGVARLALHRLPGDERVVTPHASALALTLAPAAAVANLRRLQDLGARRDLGFIDALDYTPRRQVRGEESVAVDACVAHHQASTLIAACAALTDGAPRGWTMGDSLFGAMRPLLHEPLPHEVPPLSEPPPTLPARRAPGLRLVHETDPLQQVLPTTQLLSNTRHAVVLRASGAGFSSWNGIALTRWRDDLPRDDLGLWFYLQRGEPAAVGAWHSITAHPAPDPAARYRSRALADRSIAEARWPDLSSRCTTWVSPDDDCELRQIELRNDGRVELVLTLASFAEVSLAPAWVEEAHPAWSKRFVQAHWSAAEQALYLRRKPQDTDGRAVHAVHFLAGCDAPVEAVRACADRARWLGRYGTPAEPRGDAGIDSAPAGEAGFDAPGEAVDTGDDPIASIAVTVRIAAGATVRLTYGLAAAHQSSLLAALVERYRGFGQVARASDRSHTLATVRLDETGFDTDTWRALLHVNTLLTGLVRRELAAAPRTGDAGAAHGGRHLLHRHGIAGVRPIVLVALRDPQGLALIGELTKALRLWSAAGLGVDLVVLHPEPASLPTSVRERLQALGNATDPDRLADAPDWHGRICVLAEDGLDAGARQTLQMLARLRLHADGRSLAQQLERLLGVLQRDREQWLAAQPLPVAPLLPAGSAVGSAVAAPAHRFDAVDGSLRFEVGATQHPARPWTNLLANPDFGCLVSEIGSGYCWAGDSRAQQITGWSNDALADPPNEWLLLHDLDRGRVWPLGRLLAAAGLREVAHAPGSTRMHQRFDDIEVTLVWSVDPRDALRQLGVELRGHGSSPRRLRLVSMLEWTLGAQRSDRLTISTRGAVWSPPGAGEGLPVPAPVRVLQATQLDGAGGRGGATAFLVWRGEADASNGLAPVDALDDWTCDRREFFDPAGRNVLPARLGRRDGAGLDPCAGLGCRVQLAPGRTATRTLLLGHAADGAAAAALLQRAWADEPAQRLQSQQREIDRLLGALRVSTPDPAFDALVNHWLPYQTLACRLWSRASFYQAASRVGFRDRLQDAAALVNHRPELLAQQIRTQAAHSAARTGAPDDLLWLPWACALYLRRSGEWSLLDERVAPPHAEPAPGAAGQPRAVSRPQPEATTLYEHAAGAIDRCLRTGSHGLPLIGDDDGDGPDRVGRSGTGESVWLGWFLCAVVGAMLPIAAARGDAVRLSAWTAARRSLRGALDDAGWDGQWYRRGFDENGSALGSAASQECRIDLVTQAWAVLSGAGEPRHVAQAFASAERLLYDREHQLLRQFDPPLPASGWFGADRPGRRVDGAQDNQAAVWALMAFAELRDGDAAWRIFSALSPAHRWQHPTLGAAYEIEPHVLADAIRSRAPHLGRGGWSWDTGSAGWMLRAAVESICGIALARDTLAVRPCLPAHWDEIGVTIRHHGRSHRLVICSDSAALQRALEREGGARRIAVGETVALDSLPDGSVHLVDAVPSAVAARQDQLEERAFTVTRTADE